TSRPPNGGTLRTHTSAAPLKLRRGGSRVRLREPLRTHTSAAPLKLALGGAQADPLALSPHSHECGPVAARYRLRFSVLPANSPHSHECGPVEAATTPPSSCPARGLSALTRVRPR